MRKTAVKCAATGGKGVSGRVRPLRYSPWTQQGRPKWYIPAGGKLRIYGRE